MGQIFALAAALASTSEAWAASTPPSSSPSASPVPATSTKGGSSGGVKDPLDYTTLSHTLAIDMLRAGSHDLSGVNNYFFTVRMFALHNSAEERNLEFEKRKKIEVDKGVFGETKIDSLSLWKPDEKLKNFKELKIDGQGIRELMARGMTEFGVPESEVAIMVEIELALKSKKFFFFGQDTAISKTSFYPIPPTKFDAPIRTNQSLAITDDKGTVVRINVRYDK
ncbi:hypothetical protein E3A20_14300 [Planctomyces bekefii]|uniref:Uncharacterized protein n=1 Tax=Planctomyces bekefii TaxID=1653850 RepID=A0A5C6M8X2_9PLAN|nr:hypothetical protein E3A20_14300 [Planctomyces bekefii]